MDKKFNKVSVKGIVFLVLFICASVVAIVFDSYIFGEQSIFNKDVTGIATIDFFYRAIPSIIRSVHIITVAMIAFWILKITLPRTVSKNNRTNTIIKLIHSLIKWVIFIITAIAILATFGVDTTTLIASAGVLTLIIGLGAQSLVADVVAGIFTVFEGNIQVGDVVYINDWRGTVQEIGLRTTKIVDWKGNVNVINNSKIEKIINLTQNPTMSESTIRVEYGESIDRVEKIIAENLPKIKEKVPTIIDGPYYWGVDELGDWGMKLFFAAQCTEDNRYATQRAINKELKKMFDENGIKVATPVITIEKTDENK